MDIIIIGAGPAGLTAALYALRANKKVLILESKTYGGQIINANHIENYPAILDISGVDFATNLYNQVINLGGEIIFEEVLSISEDKKVTTTNNVYQASAIIIATGLERRKLGLPHEEELTGKGISYCATCDGAFFRDKKVAVIGAGNTALDDALYLSDIANTVYLIYRGQDVRGSIRSLDKIKTKENIQVLSNTIVTSLNGTDKLSSIDIKTGDQTRTLDVDGVFILIGGIPNQSIYNHIIKTDKDGYIEAMDDVYTNISGIFVCGDVRKKELRQLVTATSDGAMAATAAIKYLDEGN